MDLPSQQGMHGIMCISPLNQDKVDQDVERGQSVTYVYVFLPLFIYLFSLIP